MQRRRVATGALVPGGQPLVHRRQQGTGTAGKVGDAQRAYRGRVRPIRAVQLGDGQPGQQRRRGRQRVERRQVLTVGNEALEDAAGQVVGLVYAVALIA